MEIETKTPPLVSVILPVRNGELFIREAITGIISQTYKNLQLIVIDDGSTDSTASVLKEFNSIAEYFRTEANGVWAARNLGIAMARGEYIIFQDADDISLPNRLELQLLALTSRSTPTIVFGHFEEFADPSSEIFIPETRLNVAGESPGVMALHKEVFSKIGLFETRWQLAGFLDWMLRARAAKIPIEMLEDGLLRRRIHANNSGKLHGPVFIREYAAVLLKQKKS